MLFNKNLSAIHAYLCADGYVIKNSENQKHKYYYIGLRNQNIILLKDFQEKMKQEFKINPIITKDGRCKIQNKELYYTLTKDFSYYSSNWRLPNINKENLKYWLRTFFDCEAWVLVEKAKNRHIGLDSINKIGIYQIQQTLKRFNINSKLKKLNKRNIFRLLIYGKENLIKFRKEINFLHPIKREKLNQAVNSYIDYNWRFPVEKNQIKMFIWNLLREKINNKRFRITSIKKKNLILLQKYLKELFKINSKIYDCKRYYELNIKKKEINSKN